MKRTLLFTLLALLLALALVACGGAAEEPAVVEPTVEEPVVEEPTAEEPMEEVTEEPMEEATEEPMEEATEEPMEEPTEEVAAGDMTCDDEIGCVELAPGDPIKVGVLQAISGAVASLGEDQVRGVEIAINDKGGEILGHEIELLVEDDLCSSEGGTTGTQRLVSDPDLIGIVGTSCSGAGVPASEIMSDAGLAMVSGSNTSPFLTSLAGEAGEAHNPGYYRTAHNDEVQGRAAATFAFEELGVTQAASIHDGDPYTQGLTQVFNQVFEELGGEIVLATAVNKGDTDMRPVLTSVAASGAELVFFPIFQPEGDFIVLQSKEIAGFEEIALMGADGLLSDTYVEALGDDGVGMYFSGPATPEGEAYQEFVQKYTDEYGESPIQAFHAHAYDAANMLFDAIEATAQQGEDGTLLIGRQALRDYLDSLSGFEGLTGTLACDEFGDCANPRIEVMRLDDPSAGIAGLRSNVIYTYETGQ